VENIFLRVRGRTLVIIKLVTGQLKSTEKQKTEGENQKIVPKLHPGGEVEDTIIN
jgi:hypothetical protein